MAGSKRSGKTAYGTRPYSTTSPSASRTYAAGATGASRVAGAPASRMDSSSASALNTSSPSPAREAARARTQGRRTRRKVVRTVVSIVVVAVLALGAFAFSQVRAARGVMDVLMEDAAFLASDLIALQDRLAEENYLAASDAVRDLSARTTHMKGIISSDEMGAAKSLPFIGRDLKAISQLVSTLENLLGSALTPMLEAARAYPTTNLFDGSRGVDLTALAALLKVADSAVPALREAAASLDSLPEFRMRKLGEAFDPVRVLAADAKDQLQTYGDGLERFAGIAKGLVGEDGNRTYLIVYQNTAELRATGGAPQVVGTLTLEAGKPTLGDFGFFGNMMAGQAAEAAGISDVEMAISRDGAAQTRGANYLPDFGRAAGIWAAAFEEKTGTPVDGVIALSPHMLQRLLNFAGGISLSDGTKMDGANTARALLRDLYWNYFTGWYNDKIVANVDKLYVEAVSRICQKALAAVTADTWDRACELFNAGFAAHEAFVWLADEAGRAGIAVLNCGGMVTDDPTTPVLGVHFSTFLTSKTGWWLARETLIGDVTWNEDGTASYPVTTTFANTITAEEARRGGKYIMGNGQDGTAAGVMKPIIDLWAPCGGSITDLEASLEGTWTEVEYGGNRLLYTTDTLIRPGETLTLSYTVTVSFMAKSPLAVWTSGM